MQLSTSSHLSTKAVNYLYPIIHQRNSGKFGYKLPAVLPEFVKTKQKIKERYNEFFKWAVDQYTPPPFRNVPKRIMYEGGTIKSQHSDTVSYETPIERVASTITLSTSEVLANPDAMYEKLLEAAPAFAEQQIKNMINAISVATEAVGNSYQVQDITPEFFLDMVTRQEIPFDSNGAPQFPQLVAGPAMHAKFVRMAKDWAGNPAYQQRFDEIIAKKRQQWHDRQASRKLDE